MQQILIFGGGKVGRLVAALLARTTRYDVHILDKKHNEETLDIINNYTNITKVTLDYKHREDLDIYIRQHKISSIVSCLPYYCGEGLALLAVEHSLRYFDLSEDVATANKIILHAQKDKTCIVNQCGLAPGFISIITSHIMKKFDAVSDVKMRVGALPVNSSNALQYGLTWSTAGLVNEYSQSCLSIEGYKIVEKTALEELEEIKIDGLTYEAFNTSGGVGTLVKSYAGIAENMNYKTIRYPGHCHKMKFLLHDLALIKKQQLLCDILEHAIPQIRQDVVLVFVSVTGKKSGSQIEENYAKKFYPNTIDGITYSALQLCTASSLCAVIDLVVNNKITPKEGKVLQEDINIQDFYANEFGKYFN